MFFYSVDDALNSATKQQVIFDYEHTEEREREREGKYKREHTIPKKKSFVDCH